MGLFSPIWMKKNLSEKKLDQAIEALNKLDDRKLGKAAIKSPEWKICEAAVKKLMNQEILAKVVKDKKAAYHVRKDAVKKLMNQEILAKVVKDEKDDYIRLLAVKNITDRKVLEEIADKDSDLYVRMMAMSKLPDSALSALSEDEVEQLCDVHSMFHDWPIKKLTDQALLTEIALKDMKVDARKAAVEGLTSQSILAEIAIKDKDEKVRKTAVERISDQKVLAEIAQTDNSYDMRLTAARKLTDETVLAKIALTDEDPNIRSTAVEKLESQTELVKIAKRSTDFHISKIAAEKVTDGTLLPDIAENAASEGSKMNALARLAVSGDTSALNRLIGYLNEKDFLMEHAVYLLKDIYKKTDLSEVRSRIRKKNATYKSSHSDDYNDRCNWHYDNVHCIHLDEG